MRPVPRRWRPPRLPLGAVGPLAKRTAGLVHRGRQATRAPVATPGRRALTLMAVLVLVLGGLGLTDLATRGSIGRTDASLSAVHDRTRLVLADLATTDRELLVARTQQSGLLAALHQIDAELTSTDDRLSTTRYILGQETARVDQLNACLNGVVEALNQLSVNDTNGAVASLTSVQPTCGKAQSGV